MIVYDLNSGRKEYPGYDEIEDRRGRSRRADGTYMGYGRFLPPYDHYGSHDKMKELEEREDELEERERRLEERERHHEMKDREYRRMGYESYPTDYYGDERYYGDGPMMRRGRGRGRGRSSYWGEDAEDSAYQKYVDTYGYHFSGELAIYAVTKMVNVDGSKRIWKQAEVKDIFDKCGAKKPDKATWGDVQYVFAMYYSDGFPKVFKCENELVKATLMYLDDPDAPDGVAFIRWLAVQEYLGEKINWKDMI